MNLLFSKFLEELMISSVKYKKPLPLKIGDRGISYSNVYWTDFRPSPKMRFPLFCVPIEGDFLFSRPEGAPVLHGDLLALELSNRNEQSKKNVCVRKLAQIE